MASNQQNARINTINPCELLQEETQKKAPYVDNDMVANSNLMYNIQLANDDVRFTVPNCNFGSNGTAKSAVITDHKQYDQGHHMQNNMGLNNEPEPEEGCCDCCYGDCDLCVGDDCCNTLEGGEGDCCIVS